MSKNVKRIIPIVLVLVTIICLTILIEFQYSKKMFEDSLNGTLLYTAEKGRIIGYDLNNDVKNTLLELGYYNNVFNCYYNNEADLILAPIEANGKKELMTIGSSGNKESVDLPDEFEKIVVKNDNLYAIVDKESYKYLYKLNLQDQSVDVVASFENSVQLYNTACQRLYFKEIGKNVAYYDKGKKYECPSEITNIVAGNDEAIASYYPEIGEIAVFDSNTWEQKFRVKIGEEPINAALNSDSTKIIYCVSSDRDLFAGNTTAYKNFVILDLISGKKYKYKTNDNERVEDFFCWISK